MVIRIDRASGVPIHDQIKHQIVGLVHAGQVRSGDQLPTIRALSIELAVNINTVARAYRELDQEGVIATRQGQGTFVTRMLTDVEMRDLRRQTLRSLIGALGAEAERLGYSTAELADAFREWHESLES